VAGDPGTGTAGAERERSRLALLWAVPIGLVLVLAGIVFVLPRWVAPVPPPAVTAAPTAASPAPPRAAEPAVAEAPVTPEADAPVQRKAAQQLLEEALAAVTRLEAAQAEQWAKTPLHEVRERIAAGEKAYRERRYRAAQALYRDAAADAARIADDIPATVSALVDRGLLALAQGDSAAAAAAFDQALAIAPDNADARSGRARAGTLDRVLALIGQAESYARMGADTEALAAYREAVRIDPLAPGAAAAIADIEREQRAQEFAEIMAAGFSALAAQDHERAHAAFSRAQKLDPRSPDVAAALRQAENQAASAEIAGHLRAAARAAEAERWQDAIAAYDAALAIDDALATALDGRAVAVRRNELDRRLERELAGSRRLIEPAAYAAAERVLADARAVAGGGQRLTGQIERLAGALRLARTPVAVALHSDGITTVSIERVGALGRFAERRLELLPGRYTGRGERAGYREVRVEFEILPAAAPPVITIQCDEKYAFGS
jgi:tetratricopeptide (TPR) repeat protein